MKRTTRRRVREAVAKLPVPVDLDLAEGGGVGLYADLPEGWHWIANGSASLHEPCASYGERWVGEACADLLDRISMGVERINV